MEWAEKAAYGILELKPEEFYALTPLELEKMLSARERVKQSARWETAYWVSMLLNTQLKKRVKVEQLMRPFLPKRDASLDNGQFFANFAAERRQIKNGNNRRFASKNRR